MAGTQGSLIKPLPLESSHLLIHTLLLTNYELVVRQTLESFIRAGSDDLDIALFPRALRFIFSSKKAPCVPPLALLETLSAQCSIEYRSESQTVHMRGAKLLDKPAPKTIHQGCELQVWEMFFAVPVRRRLQQARDYLEIINATRNMIIPVIFANSRIRCKVKAEEDTEILSWMGDGLSVHGIQAVLGTCELSFTPVRIQLKDCLVTGFVSRSGFSNSRVQYAAVDGDFEAEWLSNIVKSSWKRFLNCKASQLQCASNLSQYKIGRHAAFVIHCTTNDRGRRKYSKHVEAVALRRDVQNELLLALTFMLMGTKKRKVQWSNGNNPVESRGALVPKRPRFAEAEVQRRKESTLIPPQRIRVGRKCSVRQVSECTLRRHVGEWYNPTYDNSGSIGIRGGYWERKIVCIDKERLKQVRIVGQVDYKFIVVSDERGLYVVDQHAASERDLFERLLRKAERGIEAVECLERIALSRYRREIASLHSEILRRWGWHLEITEDEVLMTGIPSVCDVVMTKNHLLELLDEVRDNDHGVVAGAIPQFVRRTVASAACHKAVRFGDRLSHEQSENVIRALAKCDNPFCCAHGRPSIVPLAIFG
ncbi:DNA mismatch repair protein MutL [Gracilaria domingensis]|nr:DNA mismatch repair protein MutL [Gracilaria domingensis]